MRKKITIVITDFFKDSEKIMCLNYFLMTINLCTFPENYHGSNTGFLVAGLVSIVSGVFLTFALVALCYRSSVVHKNITLCLRLVRYLT
jgi:pilus assembly protein TadC